MTRWPSEADQMALAETVVRNFGPCTCGRAGRTCAGHEWLAERDRRSHDLPRWLRLDFVRSQRERFIAAEFRGCGGCKSSLCPVCARLRESAQEREAPTTLPF